MMRLYENKFSLATARKDRLMGPQRLVSLAGFCFPRLRRIFFRPRWEPVRRLVQLPCVFNRSNGYRKERSRITFTYVLTFKIIKR